MLLRQDKSVTSRGEEHPANSASFFHLSRSCVMADNGTATALNPNALSPEDAARILTRASGQPVTLRMIETDIGAGAPTNADGTINLVNYAAWLVKVAAGRETHGEE